MTHFTLATKSNSSDLIRMQKEAEKARIWADNERSRKETEQRRREKAELDKMEDRLLEAMTRAGAKVQQRRLRTEKEVRWGC